MKKGIQNQKEKILGFVLPLFFFIFTIAIATLLLNSKEEKTFPRDEKTQIVFLGDSNIAFRRDDTDVPELVAEKLDVTTYNCALGGTSASRLDSKNRFDSYYESCCLYELSNMILAQKMIPAQDNMEYILGEYEHAKSKLDLLMDMDFSRVDYIVLNYGMNDYLMGIPAESKTDPYDDETYAGALREMIRNFQREFPQMKFIVCSITYYHAEDCRDECGKNFGGGTLYDYRDAAKTVAEEFENVYFLDNLTLLGINYETQHVYMYDCMHFNTWTQELFSRNLAECIQKIETGRYE